MSRNLVEDFSDTLTLKETGLSTRTVTTQDRLERRKKELEEELMAVNNAITLFGQHPEISTAIDLIGKIRF